MVGQFCTHPALLDSDQDGMPDAWEKTNNLNPNNSSDRNLDLNGDGYTALEVYLHERVVNTFPVGL